MDKCRARFRSDRFLKAGLIALLALILCSAAIGAAAGDDPSPVSTAEDLIKAVAEANFDVILDDDIELTETLNISTTGTLDLGGHVLSLQNGKTGSVIIVGSSGNLTLKDTHTTEDVHYFQIAEKDGDKWTKLKSPWVLAAAPTGEEFSDHTIALEEIDSYDGEYGWAKQDGDGQYVYHYVKVTGGVITGGSASKFGGVLVTEGGTFTMSGGSIAGNSASSGSGVEVYGTFTMSGGKITGNSTDEVGGGVTDYGTFTMEGGSIAGNKAGYNGGGVFVSGSTFNVSGAPVIKDNTKDGAANNVYLTNPFITVIGNFSGEIHVWTENKPIGTFGTIATGVTTPGADHFISDYAESLTSGHYVGEKGSAVVGGDELKWAADPSVYLITIADIKDGTVSASPSFAIKDAEITLTATPDEGFELDEWIVKAGEIAVKVTGDKFSMPSSDVTVSATFKESGPEPGTTHTVTFMSNGEVWRTDDVNDGQPVEKPADPTKEGYDFVHWLAENGTAYDFSTPVTDDITLTAKWADHAPDTPEEQQAFIDDLISSPEKIKTLKVTADNKEAVIELLKAAKAAGVEGRITLEADETSLDILKDIVSEAASGGYAPVNLEVSADTIDAVKKLIDDVENRENIALIVKQNGDNIKEISDLIDQYPGVKVEIPEGTKITPADAGKDAIINVLKAAKKSGTADNLLFEVNTPEAAEVIKEIAKEVPGAVSLLVTGENIELIKDIISGAAVGGYGPVNLEVSEDTIGAVSELLDTATEEDRENIALVIKKNGDNIEKISELITKYPGVNVEIPEGTKITPTDANRDIIINVLKAAEKSGTADKLNLILTGDNAEAIAEIADAVAGVVVEIPSCTSESDIRTLLEAGITLSVTEANKTTVLAIAKDRLGVRVEVTGENKSIVEELLEGGAQLTLPMRRDGTNAAEIISLCAEYPDAHADVPDTIVFTEETTLPVNTGNTEILRETLKAATNGESADKIILDIKSDGANVKGAVSLIGDENIDGDNIQFTNIPEDVKIGTENNLAKYHLPYDVQSKDVEEKLSEIQISGITSAAALSNNDVTLIEDESTIPELKDPSRGYKDLVVFSVFQVIAKAKDGKPVELTLKFKQADLGTAPDAKQYYIRHYNTATGIWENHIAPKTAEIISGYVVCTYEVTEFSPFALVTETLIKKDSSSGEGSSVWGTETAEPTATPTETPTAQPTTEVPTVKPTASPTETGASPAPFAGLLAGLGAAACVLAARRK